MIFLQIPEATPTTVRAVVSTVNSGASKPHLVITETLSTIDFEVIMIRRGGVYSGGGGGR